MLNVWLVTSAALVFFMQAGFLSLECGLVRDKNVKSVAFKNLVDCILVTKVYLLLGFGLMFGDGLILGNGYFGLENLPQKTGVDPYVFALYQLGFAATTVTIVSGAIAGRTAFLAYVVLALFVGAVVYPVFGHWAWGNLLETSHQAWLASAGFVDFAGSTVVHSLGGWIALVAAVMVGPRLGRFDPHGEPFRPHSYALAILGTFILWFGWFGFNGGSVGSETQLIGPVLVNTCLAAAAGGTIGYAHAVMLQGKRGAAEKFVGATLAGLVAITACCHVVRPLVAPLVGIGAGLLHNWAYDALIRFQVDDAVGVFPVHTIGGVWGTLSVALFGRAELLPQGRLEQLGIQTLGCVVCMVWALASSFAVLWLIKKTLGLRVSPEEELAGVSVAFEHEHVPGPVLTEAELLALLEGHD